MEALRVTQGLLDARVTLQRLGDARILHGWIVGVDGVRLTVRAGDDPPVALGERFAARTARLNGDVAFLAQLTAAAPVCAEDALRRLSNAERPTMLDFGDRTYHFEILGQMLPLPASGDPRYVCEPTRVVVDGCEAELRDVSPQGMGVVTLVKLPVGIAVRVVVPGERGPLEVQAEVRYCRALASLPPLYRVGLLVRSAGRVDRARWLGVVRERSMVARRGPAPEDPPPAIEPVPIPTPEETGIEWACLAAEPAPLEPEVELWEGRGLLP